MSHNNNRMNDMQGKIFFKYYKAEKKLGEGSFGKIYTAINIKTKELYAIKMERKEYGQGLLETEAHILSHLKGFGIPEMKTYGYNQNYNILVMELLGNSLEDYFQKMKKSLYPFRHSGVDKAKTKTVKLRRQPKRGKRPCHFYRIKSPTSG